MTEFNEKLTGVELLSEAANKFLFLQCFNDIDHAINGAREAATLKPTTENTALLCELEYFYQNNKIFYTEAKKISSNIITAENRPVLLEYSISNTNAQFSFSLDEHDQPTIQISDSIDSNLIEALIFEPSELEELIQVLSNQLESIKSLKSA